jgi:hypothetical protein
MFNFLKSLKKSPEELIAEANLPDDYRILQLEDGRYIYSRYLHGIKEWVDYEHTACKYLSILLLAVNYNIKRLEKEAKLEAMPRKVVVKGT